MKYLDKIFKRNIKDKITLVYENDMIIHEVDEWVKQVGREKFSDILLEVGFKEGDTVYLYSKGLCFTEFYYSVNEDNVNTKDTILISYGAFRNRGASITIENCNKMISYAIKKDNKFEINSEEIYISDKSKYTRYYHANNSIMWFNSNVGDKDYILKLSIFRDLNDDIFGLDNEMELEKYLCNLEMPCNLLEVYKRICEICNIDLAKYNSFNLELHKKNNRFQNESDVISHIKFIHGEFNSLSYIKDNKKISYNLSGDWSYHMIDDDDLVKLSIDVKHGNINCNITSNNDGELGDYFKDLLLYDMNEVKNEIDNVKKLVRKL